MTARGEPTTTNKEAAKINGGRMTSVGGRRTLIGLGILLLVLSIVVALIPVDVPGKNGAAAILALVTAGAVAIERALESFWSMVGTSRLGNWWPLKPIGERLDAFIEELNGPLNKFYEQAQPRVNDATEASESLAPWLDGANNYLGDLRERIKKLQQLEPGNLQAREIAAGASRAVVGLQKHYPELRSVAADANKALASVNKFVQTFEDNPARRLMSLYAGAVLGLLAACILGLDAVQAVFGGVPSGGLVEGVYKVFPGIGAAATGLAMGFGATPAHELIKTLKETKERNKARTPQQP